MCNKFFLVLFLFALTLSGAAAAENDKSLLWNYASPSADVILYFNTRQPEQAMDKELWQLIQKDKNKAIDSDPEEQLFDIKNRDMEAVANIYINSFSPFSATIEGVANITGNIGSDIRKLLTTVGKEGGPAPQINEIDKIPRYNYSVSGSENMPPVDVMFTPVNNNQLHFRINIVPNSVMAQTTIGTSQGNIMVLETLPQQEQAFVVAGNVEKFALLPILSTEKGAHIMHYLSQIKTLCVYGNVQSRHLLVNADIILKDQSFAGNFVQLIGGVKDKFAQLLQLEELPQIVSKGKVVSVSIKVDIADAWLMITRITPLNQSTNSPAKK